MMAGIVWDWLDNWMQAHIVVPLASGRAATAVSQVGTDRHGIGEVGGPESVTVPSTATGR